MTLRIGYLIPEFPGQTHTFFWREINALEQMGVEVDIVSTQLPPPKIMSHDWIETARSRTTYLFPLSRSIPKILGELFSHSLLNTVKIIQLAITTKNHTFKQRIRLLALAIIGVELSLIAREKQWQHLHVHSCADAANIAMISHLLSSLTYSLTLHGSLKDYGINQEQKWSNASFKLVITQRLYQEVKQELPEYATFRIAIAPMGVDIDQFSRHHPYIPYKNGETLSIFTCGRLNPCKGHNDLIQAIKLLRDQGIQAKLTIAGEDEQGGVGYRKTIETLIQKLNLEKSIHLLGAVSEVTIKEYLEETHLFALASLQEPLGVAIMEAMAMEIPVVVTNAGGVKELVEDGVEGKLVEPQSPTQLAQAIQEIIADSNLMRFGKAGRKKIVHSFSSKRSAKILIEQIQQENS